jgi:hypothetical protein
MPDLLLLGGTLGIGESIIKAASEAHTVMSYAGILL